MDIFLTNKTTTTKAKHTQAHTQKKRKKENWLKFTRSHFPLLF